MQLQEMSYPKENICQLTITGDAQAMEQAAQAAYERLRGEIKLKGFEKGEADRAQIEAVKGESHFWFDAVNDIMDAEIPPIYKAVVAQHHLEPVGECSYDLVSVTKEDGFTVQVQFCLLPTFTIGDYKGLVVTQKSIAVTAEEMEIVYQQNPVPEGQDVEQYRNLLCEKAAARKKETLEADTKNRIIAQLETVVSGEVPEPLITEAYETNLRQLYDVLQQQDITMQDFLKNVQRTQEELKATMEASAERRVRVKLALLQIAHMESLYPSMEEVEAEILVRAEMIKTRLPNFAKTVDRTVVMQSMARKRAQELLIANAVVKEESAV